VPGEIEFRRDLFRGTAPYYDRHRPPYPDALLADLRRRLPVSGTGRLLDLACGTGQLALPLAGAFTQVVAVDQEPDFVEYGRARSADTGITNITWMRGSAETVVLDGGFELITIGNAFHRLDRSLVAERALSWVGPGGGIALVWGDGPNLGESRWQAVFQEVCARWVEELGATDRVPAGWQAVIDRDPHEQVLRRAGFDYVGRWEFTMEQTWTVETLIGFVYSTSYLARPVLGDRAAEFEADLGRRLRAEVPSGQFLRTATYAYQLARRPSVTG
jgi:SAM-dependent methyltransferase